MDCFGLRAKINEELRMPLEGQRVRAVVLCAGAEASALEDAMGLQIRRACIPVSAPVIGSVGVQKLSRNYIQNCIEKIIQIPRG